MFGCEKLLSLINLLDWILNKEQFPGLRSVHELQPLPSSWLVTLVFPGGTGFQQGLPVFREDGERQAQPSCKGGGFKFIVVTGDWF